MTSILRRGLVFFVAFTAFAGAAFAQRNGVPVVDFKDIPVSLSTQKALTVEQVRQAFTAAALAQQWEVVPLPNGTLQLTTLKNDKHTVVVNVAVSADKYSVLYHRSEDLNYVKDVTKRAVPLTIAQVAVMDLIKSDQAKRFAALPEAKFAVARDTTSIHPSYEAWLHDLLGGVRRQLAAL